MNGASTPAPVAVTASSVTVNSPGSVALPIKMEPVPGGHSATVTITGLTSYESVTDTLDHHVFTGNSITLTAAEVQSGLTLSSNYAGTGHPINQLSITASETFGNHTFTSAPQTLTVIDPPVSGGSTSTSSSSGLSLQVSGDNLAGTDPQIQVFVDGQQVGSSSYTVTADHGQGQTQTIQIAGTFDPSVAHQVQVKFINDNWDGTSTADGHDINVYVESISLNGQTLTGAQGTNNASNGVVHPANANEAAMDVNGTLAFSVPAAPAPQSGSGGSTSSGLSLQVSGDNLAGTDPQIQVFVDGQQVGSGSYTVTADHAQGQTQTIQIAGTFDPSVTHQVQVKFINDNWDGTSTADGHDINVYVESMSMNGVTFTGAQGTNTASNGVIQPANPNEAVMDIDGTLTFNVPDPPPAGGTGSSGSGSTSTGGSGSGSGSSGSDVGTGAGSPPSGAGFYVSPNGNDNNAGTIDAPFATLARAQQAMENSSTKATYVEAGTYHLDSALNLTGADSGETWQYYPANGVDTAIIDGGGSTSVAFNGNGATNVTINGLTIQHFTVCEVLGTNPSTGWTVENSNLGVGGFAGSGVGASSVIATAAHWTVENNYVHDWASAGITVWAFNAGDSADGTVVENNAVINTSTQLQDSGAIYVSMKDSGDNGGHVTISNNYISGTGDSSGMSHSIYLDDNASNVTVSGNVIAPPPSGMPSNGGNWSAILVHNGNNNVIQDNIVDLGSSSFVNPVTWGYDSGSINGMGGNTFTNNVVLSNFTGANQVDFGYGDYQYLEAPNSNAPSSWFTVNDNLYYNYASGGSVFSNGNLTSDAHAVTGENPEISGMSYQIASGSPVFGGPVSFAPMVGGWGPAGFVIPQNAATPSQPV